MSGSVAIKSGNCRHALTASVPGAPEPPHGDASRRLITLRGALSRAVLGIVLGVAAWSAKPAGAVVQLDLSAYRPDSGVQVEQSDDGLQLRWQTSGGTGQLSLNLAANRPLISSLGLFTGREAFSDGQIQDVSNDLVQDVDPVFWVTVGSRQGSRTEGWVAFFDKVHQRPYKTYAAELDLRNARVVSRGQSTTVELGEVRAGPFHGELWFTVYPGTRLVHVEAVVSTSEDRRAILYDAGLVGSTPTWQRTAWMDTSGQLRRRTVKTNEPARHLAVRHRAIMAESDAGTLVVFPPPHQFFFPLDFSTNLRFTWLGQGLHASHDGYGLGVRQHPDGDQRFVPWFNAPPETKQRLGVFYLLSDGSPEQALEQVLRYTHGDQFPAVPGHFTFTSHYHFAHTMDVMNRRATGRDTSFVPSFVTMIKQMGVNAVHMGEFHGDGNPRDPGPRRLPQLELMYQECERLSDDEFLLLPGEEPNVHFGGHWMNLFPKPVYWIMGRQEGEPFVEQDPYYGNIYRVGSSAEVLEMMQREHGLVWTAHARIKSSHGFPDQYRDSPFYRSSRFLGAAWKAMPADLSRPKLGERVLDLLSDMANWGQQKYVIGEVDVFKLDPTHELYAHMNINYVRLEELPRFEDGWQPLLDALSQGKFFVSTGEVLLGDFLVGGSQSGETLQLVGDRRPELSVTLDWTFPLRFAEVVSGDGRQVYRQRIDLSHTRAFGRRRLTLHPDLADRRWVRFEVWDVAANGAFTQPIWLEQ